MVVCELLRVLKSSLSDNAEFEAKEILKEALRISINELVLYPRREVSDVEYIRAMEMLKRRIKGEPLQYILGYAEFMSLTFEVNRFTLIPRSDTETLVETLIDEISDSSPRILDIGTGSGCIGISLAKYTSAVVTLADISEEALKTAQRNAAANGVDAEIVLINILEEIPKGKFDIIVSNPPYIKSEVINGLQTEVKDNEPITALDGGEDGLVFYRRITDIAPRILTSGGMIAYEIGFDQGKAVSSIMSQGFEDIKVIKDLCGNDRVVTGRIAR